MKKYIFCFAATLSMGAMANANTIADIEISTLANSVKSCAEDCAEDDVASCTGNILILDAKGNVKNTIQFTGSTATSLQDCIGLYQVAVYKVTLGLGQGETTGGTVTFK